ncbi:ThuA domain-containing protein [Aestuariimicrobium soli]|uniref:ThuA domain-containing protein n=1 Tax=Aestuariimicrobium soli TaxID=2035834 RepID=UPI003EBA4481
MADLLVLTATHPNAFRHHEAIEAGVPALRRLAASHELTMEHTEDTSVLNPAGLAGVRAVVFHQCNGEILRESQRAALQAAVEAGCGFAGVHNSTGAERTWPAYLELIGARFAGHPAINDVRRDLVPVEPDHPSVAPLPKPWSWSDEWYEFEAPPVGVEPLLELADEPGRALCWRGRVGAGSTWYTALGHRGSAWSDPAYLAHVWGGISSVLAPPAASPRSAR